MPRALPRFPRLWREGYNRSIVKFIDLRQAAAEIRHYSFNDNPEGLARHMVRLL